MTSREQAQCLYKKGYNCTQAVACAYASKVGIDEKLLFGLMEGFGRGMGGMEATCGAISGAIAIAGLVSSSTNLEKPDSKDKTYKLTKEMVNKFKINNTVVCQELKGRGTGKVLRSCYECIDDACRILEDTYSQLK